MNEDQFNDDRPLGVTGIPPLIDDRIPGSMGHDCHIPWGGNIYTPPAPSALEAILAELKKLIAIQSCNINLINKDKYNKRIQELCDRIKI